MLGTAMILGVNNVYGMKKSTHVRDDGSGFEKVFTLNRRIEEVSERVGEDLKNHLEAKYWELFLQSLQDFLIYIVEKTLRYHITSSTFYNTKETTKLRLFINVTFVKTFL